jgi:hypothetical protein
MDRNAEQLDPSAEDRGLSMSLHRLGLAALIMVFLSAAFFCGLWLSKPADQGLRSHRPSSSPSNKHTVVIREPRFAWMDRHFTLEVTYVPTGVKQLVFHSTEQSTSITKERFVWSPDSRYVALVGDRYFVVEGSETRDKDFLFLVYDTVDNVVYCNADNDFRFPRMKAATATTLFPKGFR